MGYAVAQLALQVFSKPEQLTVMVVAAGEMNSLVAKHLAEMGVGKIILSVTVPVSRAEFISTRNCTSC